MKLLKLSEEHYIIADKLDIKVGDWITDKYSVWQWKDDSSLLGRLKVTHSTQPLYKNDFWAIQELKLSKVKELLGEVDVKKKAYLAAQKRYRLEHIPLEQIDEYGAEVKEFVRNFIVTYNQALEDNKEKKYTEEDLREVVRLALEDAEASVIWSKEWYPKKLADRIIQSLQPKTEWEVEFVDDKLKLI